MVVADDLLYDHKFETVVYLNCIHMNAMDNQTFSAFTSPNN